MPTATPFRPVRGAIEKHPVLLGYELRTWMATTGTTQQTLAAAAHCHQSQVSRVVRGKPGVGRDTVAAICRVAGIAVTSKDAVPPGSQLEMLMARIATRDCPPALVAVLVQLVDTWYATSSPRARRNNRQ